MEGMGPDWKGLLKWSMANSDGTQPAREISDEERRWFNEAMQSQFLDVIKRMKEIALVMSMPVPVLEAQGVTVEELEGMLEELQEHVESIDMANGMSLGLHHINVNQPVNSLLVAPLPQ
jgi:hsp70-interacting protein